VQDSRSKILVGSLMLGVLLAGAPAARAAPKAETESYTVTLSAQRSYKVGQPGFVELVIAAKPGFKINDQYPTKFVADPAPAGVTIPEKTLRGGRGAFTPKRGVLKLKLIPSKRGSARISGNAAFSVCNETACIVGKKHLDVVVTIL